MTYRGVLCTRDLKRGEMLECPYKFGIPTLNFFLKSYFGDLRYKLMSERVGRSITWDGELWHDRKQNALPTNVCFTVLTWKLEGTGKQRERQENLWKNGRRRIGARRQARREGRRKGERIGITETYYKGENLNIFIYLVFVLHTIHISSTMDSACFTLY